jgi:hypothetical protein
MSASRFVETFTECWRRRIKKYELELEPLAQRSQVVPKISNSSILGAYVNADRQTLMGLMGLLGEVLDQKAHQSDRKIIDTVVTKIFELVECRTFP